MASKAQKNQQTNHRVPKILPLKQLRVRKGFNPRTELGDTSDLVELIKTHGQLAAIIVVPSDEADGGGPIYEIVAGERRYTALGELGKTEAMCHVIENLDLDSPEALAIAMAENDADGRKPLSPLDQARSYQRLYAMVDGKSENEKFKKMAAILGRTSTGAVQNIRVTLNLLKTPARVQEMLEAGHLSKWAAITLNEVPADVRESVAANIRPGATEADIKRLALETRRERDAGLTEPGTTVTVGEETEDESDTDTPTERPASSTVRRDIILTRSKTDISDKIDEIAEDLVDAIEDDNEPAQSRCRERIAALMWCLGVTDEIDTTKRDFKESLNALVTKIENARGRASKKG